MSEPTFVVRTGPPPMLFTPKGGDTDRFMQYNKPAGVKKISFAHRLRQYRWFKFFAFALVLLLAVPALLLTGGGLFGKTTGSTPAANAGVCSLIFGDPWKAFSEKGNKEAIGKAEVSKNGNFVDYPQVVTDPLAIAFNAGVSNWNSTTVTWNSPEQIAITVGGERPSYNAFGTSFTWKAYNIEELDGECSAGKGLNKALTTTANMMLNIYGMVVSFSLTVFGWAMSLDLFNIFKSAVVDVIGTLQQTLYLEYLTPLIIIAALWIGWNGIVKRRNSQVTQGTVWLVLAVSITFVFFKFPGPLIVGSNSLIQGVSLQLMMTVAGIGNKTNGGQSVCKSSLYAKAPTTGGSLDQKNFQKGLDDAIAEKASQESIAAEGIDRTKTIGDYKTDKENFARGAQCLLWETFYYQPWAIGQFGDTKYLLNTPPSAEEMALWSSKEDGDKRPYNTWASIVMKQGGVSMPELYLMSTRYAQNETLAIVKDGGKTNRKENIDTEKRNQRRDLMMWMTCGNDIKGGKTAADCRFRSTYLHFSGEDPAFQIGYVFLGFVSLLFAFTPLFLMATMLIFYSLMGIILWMVLPFFLLLGVHPGFGRKLLLGWCEQMVSNVLKRVGLALIMGLTLLLLQIVLNVDSMNIIVKAFMMCIIGVGMLLFRGKFVKMLSRVNFGGGGNPDAMGQELKHSAKKNLGRAAYAGGHSVGKFKNVREAGGGRGAAALAGGLGLAVGMGRSIGNRGVGTSPVRAGSYGLNQGRKGRHARKKNEKYARGQMENIVSNYNKADTDDERRKVFDEQFRPFVDRMKKYNIPIPSIAGMDDLWYAAVLNGVLQPHDMEQGETKIPRPASAAESGGGTEEANTGETGNTNTDGDAGGRQAEVADPEPGKAHSNTENADTGSGAGSKKSEVSDPEPAHNNADSANSNGESGKGTGTPEPVHVGGGGTTVVFEKDNQPLVDGLGKVADTINASANSTINAIGRVEQTNIEGDARISGDIQKINGQTNENLEKIVDNTAELNNGGTPPFNFNDPKNNREAAVIIADAVRKAVPPSSK